MFGQKKSKIALNLLKIDDEGYHLSVEVKINGKPATLIVDPGASRTVFDEQGIKAFLKDESEAQLINRKTTGVGTEEIQAKRIEVNTVQIGDVIIPNYNAAAVDLSGINEHYKHLHFGEIEGLLGGDILEEHKAIIDYKKLTLTLSEKS